MNHVQSYIKSRVAKCVYYCYGATFVCIMCHVRMVVSFYNEECRLFPKARIQLKVIRALFIVVMYTRECRQVRLFLSKHLSTRLLILQCRLYAVLGCSVGTSSLSPFDPSAAAALMVSMFHTGVSETQPAHDRINKLN